MVVMLFQITRMSLKIKRSKTRILLRNIRSAISLIGPALILLINYIPVYCCQKLNRSVNHLVLGNVQF